MESLSGGAFPYRPSYGVPTPLPRGLTEHSALTLACVASVSVRFRSKEQGKRVKNRAKNGTSKRAGGGGKERMETLADKPRDFENRPLGLSFLSACTDI